MRRYIFDKDLNTMPSRSYDVAIAGGGLAGLYTALSLDKELSCAILVKDALFTCNSSLAQGGIAAVTREEDDTSRHLEDTLKAGGPVTNERMSRMMIEKGPAEVIRLTDFGVRYDTDAEGQWYSTREGGHTKDRVLHCGGDATGHHLIDKLVEAIRQRDNIDILENHFMIDVVTNDREEVCGMVAYEQDYVFLAASRVVIATGGIGALYQHTTNQNGITGDGIAAAMRAGAKTCHMEFVQFHPSAFYNKKTGESSFLISEAVRGEGGILRNENGEAFMEDRHPMKDLAPRDLVAREIFREMEQQHSPCVYLDITSRSRDYLSKRFPNIFERCREQGIDISKDWIPVAPVQHYFMGGIRADEHARTNLQGLYACGEAACTGVHGANRLASNSLLECVFFARQCATHINHNPQTTPAVPDLRLPEKKRNLEEVQGMRRQIRQNMQKYGGIVRNQYGLLQGLRTINCTIRRLEEVTLRPPEETSVFNMALVAREILSSALERQESTGAHYREDQSSI
ncbi:MAG: L-aspartate oxidase [Bacteroidales bacterium]